MDSTGLAVLARMIRHAREANGHVQLVAPTPPVLSVLRISGMLDMVQVVDELPARGRAVDLPTQPGSPEAPDLPSPPV
jgi:anti-anti-sigma regulatory factor